LGQKPTPKREATRKGEKANNVVWVDSTKCPGTGNPTKNQHTQGGGNIIEKRKKTQIG